MQQFSPTIDRQEVAENRPVSLPELSDALAHSNAFKGDTSSSPGSLSTLCRESAPSAYAIHFPFHSKLCSSSSSSPFSLSDEHEPVFRSVAVMNPPVAPAAAYLPGSPTRWSSKSRTPPSNGGVTPRRSSLPGRSPAARSPQVVTEVFSPLSIDLNSLFRGDHPLSFSAAARTPLHVHLEPRSANPCPPLPTAVDRYHRFLTQTEPSRLVNQVAANLSKLGADVCSVSKKYKVKAVAYERYSAIRLEVRLFAPRVNGRETVVEIHRRQGDPLLFESVFRKLLDLLALDGVQLVSISLDDGTSVPVSSPPRLLPAPTSAPPAAAASAASAAAAADAADAADDSTLEALATLSVGQATCAETVCELARILAQCSEAADAQPLLVGTAMLDFLRSALECPEPNAHRCSVTAIANVASAGCPEYNSRILRAGIVQVLLRRLEISDSGEVRRQCLRAVSGLTSTHPDEMDALGAATVVEQLVEFPVPQFSAAPLSGLA